MVRARRRYRENFGAKPTKGGEGRVLTPTLTAQRGRLDDDAVSATPLARAWARSDCASSVERFRDSV